MSNPANNNRWLDGGFWGPALRSSFIPEIEWFVRMFLERVLTAFDNIEAEADAAADEAWEGYMQQPSDGSEDPGDYAEIAIEAGIERYTRLSNVRQALLNMSAVSLWHLVEQQILFFHKRQVLSIHEENESTLHNRRTFIERMKAAGIDVEGLSSWSKLNELRVIANAVKHGEGNALNQAALLRPDILIHPTMRDEPPMFQSAKPHADRPAGGEDIYVTAADIKKYAEAAIEFWNKIADEIERVSVRS